jgi:hypothetical protein
VIKDKQQSARSKTFIFKAFGKATHGVGKAVCSVGEIDSINIESSAHGCGIEDSFANICFTDKDLNGEKGNLVAPVKFGNVAINNLQRSFPDKFQWLSKRAEGLWQVKECGSSIGLMLLFVSLMGAPLIVFATQLSAFAVVPLSAKIPQLKNMKDTFDDEFDAYDLYDQILFLDKSDFLLQISHIYF